MLDNTDKAYVFPMVDPAARGRGAGGALLDALVRSCADRGRTTVTSNAAYAGPEGKDAPPVRFAARHGFHVANTEITRHLHLPVAPALLDEVDTAGLAYRDGYTVETFVDGLPDELLPSYCRAREPADRGRADRARSTTRRPPRRRRSCASTPSATCASAAGPSTPWRSATDSSSPSPTWRCSRKGPPPSSGVRFVDRAHRGHRLGAAVKVANLRSLQADRPDVTRIDTQNARDQLLHGLHQRTARFRGRRRDAVLRPPPGGLMQTRTIDVHDDAEAPPIPRDRLARRDGGRPTLEQLPDLRGDGRLPPRPVTGSAGRPPRDLRRPRDGRCRHGARLARGQPRQGVRLRVRRAGPARSRHRRGAARGSRGARGGAGPPRADRAARPTASRSARTRRCSASSPATGSSRPTSRWSASARSRSPTLSSTRSTPRWPRTPTATSCGPTWTRSPRSCRSPTAG